MKITITKEQSERALAMAAPQTHPAVCSFCVTTLAICDALGRDINENVDGFVAWRNSTKIGMEPIRFIATWKDVVTVDDLEFTIPDPVRPVVAWFDQKIDKLRGRGIGLPEPEPKWPVIFELPLEVRLQFREPQGEKS